MTFNHRKLQQNSTCSDCGPTCPYKCSYPEFYWPPQPPPLPPQNTTIHISPYVIIIVALVGSAFLFICYYFIMVKCCMRFRRSHNTRIEDQDEELFDQDHSFEVDHPIWYITTIGLQPSVINSINIIKFKKDDYLIDGTDCSVCLSEFQDDEMLRLLPKCNHAFHIPCIDTWLRSHTNCPLCRAGILSNSLSAVLSPGDRSFSQRIGSNRRLQNENLENDIDGNRVPDGENSEDIEDSKTEYESISMDSVAVAEIVVGEYEHDQ